MADRVHVIGAGLSGLATAWHLSDAGLAVHVSEAASRPGGLIQTHHLPEGVVEEAARAFTWSERTLALFKAAGVEPTFPQEQSKRRYIFRNGRPRRMPLTPFEMAGTALRASAAWAKRDMRARDDETVAAWGHRVLGRAATTWVIAPVLQGIYASAPETLSASAIFGGRARTRGKLISPPTGMGELVDRLHEKLRDRGVTFEFNTVVDRVDPSARTVIATNAPTAARLLAPHAPQLADRIAQIRMVSLLVATTFYEPRANDCRGFGVLFPRSSGVRALGVLFNAEIFAGRSALRSETWIYGDLDPSSLPNPDELAGVISADRAQLTGRTDHPMATHVTRQIAALPVYNETILAVKAALDRLPASITLAGNYLGRLGVSALLDIAAGAAERVKQT